MSQYISKSHCKFSLKVHLIFVCKYRKRLLYGELDRWMQQEIQRIASISEFGIDAMESDKDYIHLLLSYEPKISVTMIVRRLKTMTTVNFWKTFENTLKNHFWKERVFWSDSYFACSVGDASTDTIRKYIENQG